jgi:transcription elongation factor Elf1
MNTFYKKICPNCGEEFEVSENELFSEDVYYMDCDSCGYPMEIEIEYDDDDNIIALHVF